MSYSASPDQTPSQYRLKVMMELLTQAYVLGLDVEELIEFLASQVQAMLLCPPNYNFRNVKKRIWILRGFYPKSTLFFKLTISSLDDYVGNTGYFAKASAMRILGYKKKNKSPFDDHQTFDGNALNEALTNRMENTFFGANHEAKELLYSKLRMPRCMSPKGMKLLTYQKPRKKRNAKAN